MHIRKTFWASVVLLIILLVFSQYIKDIAFTRASAVVALLIIVSYFWTNQTVNAIEVTRHARELRQQAGEIFNERFQVSNLGKLPKLWIDIIDESNIGAEHGSRMLTWLSGGVAWPYITHTLLDKRGIYVLGPTRVVAGDPFGLFYRDILFQGHERLLVLPYYEQINYFPYPSGYLPGGKALKTRSLEVTPYAVGVREYQPGDPLRRIDWKSSARKQKLMVKEFEQDPQSNICIFLDASQKSDEAAAGIPEEEIRKTKFTIADRRRYSLPKIPFEYCVSLAATLADYYIRAGKAIGLISEGQGLYKLPPDLGERQLDKLFEALAIIEKSGEMSFQELIESEISSVQKGSTVILVSATTDLQIIETLITLKQRNYLPIYVGVNPSSFGTGDSNEEIVRYLVSIGIDAVNIQHGDSAEKLSLIRLPGQF